MSCSLGSGLEWSSLIACFVGHECFSWTFGKWYDFQFFHLNDRYCLWIYLVSLGHVTAYFEFPWKKLNSELSDFEDHVVSYNSDFIISVKGVCVVLFLRCDFGGRGEHHLRYNNWLFWSLLPSACFIGFNAALGPNWIGGLFEVGSSQCRSRVPVYSWLVIAEVFS